MSERGTTVGVPEALAPLVGRWSGRGEGTWPSSGPFTYDEEMVFEDGGGGAEFPFLTFSQHAWDPETGVTFHRESGFWMADGASVSVSLAHPIGVTEIAEGTIVGSEIELRATRLERSASGLDVTGYRRRYTVAPDVITYEQFLATDPDQEPVKHVWAELRRG